MNNKSQKVYLRSLQREDLPEAMRLKESEGWNQTEKDWEVFLEGKQNINYVAEVKNKTVGTLTAINYENRVAWLGMMIVDRNYRGMGISRKMMSTAIERLQQENCTSIKLDATPEGRHVYIKLGFIEEYTIFRLVHPHLTLPQSLETDTAEIKSASEKDIPEIINLDDAIFGANRGDLIRHLVLNNPDKSFVLRDGRDIKGFALGRDGTRFTQVGPVVASNKKVAGALMLKALQPLQGKSVVIDILEDKSNTLKWLLEMGFENQRPFYRMFLGENKFPGKPESLYAICGPEFG